MSIQLLGYPILTYTRLSPVCLRLPPSTVLVSLFSMTNTSARPPRFPSVLYDLGRLVCTFQMSCRCSGPLGRVAPHLPTPCLADPADSRPACLSPTWHPAVSHLQMLSGCFGPHGSALASHLSTNVSQYAVDALSCMVLRLPPTCLQLGPPVSARVLWVFWAAQFYTYVPLVSHLPPTVSQYAVGGCSGLQEATLVSLLSSTVSQYAVVWVLWATFYFRLSPACLPVCHAGRFQKQFIVGFVGASLGWQERAFHLFPRVSHLLHKSVPVILFFGTADFTLLLLVSHLSTASFPVCGGIGTEYFFFSYLSLICRLLLSLCCP